jgi:hypothetical protein
MKYLYFVKEATGFDGYGEELMQEVHRCCKEGTGEFQKIHTSSSSSHFPEKSLQFLPIKLDEKNNIHLPGSSISIPISIPKFIFEGMILNMRCGNLNNYSLSLDFLNPKNCSLIRFILNPNENSVILDTLLVFTFNNDKRSIEVKSFCCSTQGGGVIFNFLINAVKCGLAKCPTDKYPREIILTALEEAVPFYKKYGLTEETPLELKRQLSVHRETDNDSDIQEVLEEVLENSGIEERGRTREQIHEEKERTRRSRSRDKDKDEEKEKEKPKKGTKGGKIRKTKKRTGKKKNARFSRSHK